MAGAAFRGSRVWSTGGRRSLGQHLRLAAAVARQEDRYRAWMKTGEPAAHRRTLERLPDLDHGPRISIILPSRDGKPAWVQRAIESVRQQSWPLWELCIVDDGSVCEDVLGVLTHAEQSDDRIRLTRLKSSRGIAGASNVGLDMATGDACAFLDHDDVLSPSALALLAVHVSEHPECDVFYSDEDKIDARDRRYRPTFKPAHSAFMLWRWNYVCHLLAVRTETLREHAGFDSRYDGAQDFDLILRLHQCGARMHHVPHVLYHWREHTGSTSGGQPAKPGALSATRRALEAAITRQNRTVALVTTPVVGAWSFETDADPARDRVLHVVTGTSGEEQPSDLDMIARRMLAQSDDDWREVLSQNECRWILATSPDLSRIDASTLHRQVVAAQTPGVGIVGVTIVDERQRILDAGAVGDSAGVLRHVYRGCARQDPGYRWALALGMTVAVPPMDAWLVNRDLAARAWSHANRSDHRSWFGDSDVPFSVRLAFAVARFEPSKSTVTLGTASLIARRPTSRATSNTVVLPEVFQDLAKQSLIPNLPTIEPGYLGAEGIAEVHVKPNSSSIRT